MSGERVEVNKAAEAPNTFSVAAVYKLFTDFLLANSSRNIDRGVPHYLIMGRNRYDFLKHGGFTRPITTSSQTPLNEKAKERGLAKMYNENLYTSLWRYESHKKGVALELTAKYYRIENETEKDRVHYAVTLIKDNIKGVTYPVDETTDSAIPEINRSFFIRAILGTNMNHAKVLDDPAHTLSINVEPTAAAAEILYNAFFQCPYYDIEYVKQAYVKVENDDEDQNMRKMYADNYERETFEEYFQGKGTCKRDQIRGIDLKKLILDDLYLQGSFCREIIGRPEVRKQANLLPDSPKSIYEDNLDLFCSAMKILNQIDLIRQDVENQRYVAFYYYDQLKGFDKLKVEFNRLPWLAFFYQEFLHQLLKAALKGSSKKECQQNKELINVQDKVALVLKKIPNYQTVMHIITFLSCGQEEETITLKQFRTLYNGVANSNSIDFDIVERIIKGQGDPVHIFLKSLIDASIAFNKENHNLRLINRDLWQNNITSCDVEDNTYFIPEEFKNDPEKYYYTCKTLLEENKNIAKNYDLDKLQLGSFAADRSDKIFNIEQRGQEYYITVDINQKEVGGYVVCPIPMFSGVYYKMIPNWDVTSFNRFCFSLKSADQSLNEIKIELKSTNRQEQADYYFSTSQEWVEHAVDIEMVPPNIKTGLEEICFMLVPTFFTRKDLTASFSLKLVRFE